MGYSKEIYNKAFQTISYKKKKDESTYETALAELRANDSEFSNIELSLRKYGSEIISAAMSGNTKRLEEIKTECDRLTAKKAEKLASAGIKKPEYYCAKCQDSGYFGGSLCDCVKNAAKKIVFEDLSRSLPLGDCSFDNFDLNYYSNDADASGAVPRKRATAILNLCKQFVENFPRSRSLLFMGGVGLGKTHLSLSIVKEVLNKGYGVVYGSAQNLFSAAEKEHFSYSGETTALDSLLNCDLLVIDDLGTEFYSSFAASLFYNVINSRILSGKPTVINTNLTLDELEKKYTPRILSRFIGEYEMKKFIGSDIRQIKALEK